mgnify:CR=1 FL=1
MREMHKWKDKVELSLDNRQIFFLFFGLSVVGCFVFALGVMVGRRVEWSPEGEVAALSGEGLSLLAAEDGTAEPLTFKEGLSDPATADVPPTRDPSQPPRDEAEVRAEKAEREKLEAGKPVVPRAVPVASPAVPSADPTTLARMGSASTMRSSRTASPRRVSPGPAPLTVISTKGPLVTVVRPSRNASTSDVGTSADSRRSTLAEMARAALARSARSPEVSSKVHWLRRDSMAAPLQAGNPPAALK